MGKASSCMIVHPEGHSSSRGASEGACDHTTPKEYWFWFLSSFVSQTRHIAFPHRRQQSMVVANEPLTPLLQVSSQLLSISELRQITGIHYECVENRFVKVSASSEQGANLTNPTFPSPSTTTAIYFRTSADHIERPTEPRLGVFGSVQTPVTCQ